MRRNKERTRYAEAWTRIIELDKVQSREERALIDLVAQLGHDHARSEVEFDKMLRQCVGPWFNQILTPENRYANSSYITEPKTTVSAEHFSYNTDTSKVKTRIESVERIGRDAMKRLIPLSYALAEALFLSLSFLFGFTFYLGLHGEKYFIGPWANLMLLLASIIMTVTVLAAIIEWRKLYSGTGKNSKKGGRPTSKRTRNKRL